MTVPWQMSAGSRSVFCLAKLNDATGLSRLMKKYALRRFHVPSVQDQWYLFKNLIDNVADSTLWQADVLFFSPAWLDYLMHDPAWQPLYHYFLRNDWRNRFKNGHHFTEDLMWQNFLVLLNKKRLRCHAFHFQHLKHIMNMAFGAVPSFQPVVDESLLPLTALHNILVDEYGLRYMPTMMHANHYHNHARKGYGYYSINQPTLMNTFLQTRKIENIMEASRVIKQLIDFFYDEVMSGNLPISCSQLQSVVLQYGYDVFHCDYDINNILSNTSMIVSQDQRMMYCKNRRSSHLPFCHTSSFLKGCVRFGASAYL